MYTATRVLIVNTVDAASTITTDDKLIRKTPVRRNRNSIIAENKLV